MRADAARSYTDDMARLAARAEIDSVAGQGIPVASWHAAPNATAFVDDETGISWLSSGRHTEAPARRPSAKMLYDFANLRTSDEAGILAYARKWGTLDLCSEHAMPLSFGGPVVLARQSFDNETFAELVDQDIEFHNPGYYLAADDARQCTLAGAESFDAWRDYASMFAGVVRVNTAIAGGVEADPEAWAWMGVQAGGLATLHRQRQALGAYIRWLMEVAYLRLTVDWQPVPVGEPTLRPSLTTRSLFAGLTSELVAAVAAPAKYAFCMECGLLYAPYRKTAKRNFCPSCNDDGAPSRWAARDYYERKRKAQLASENPSGDGHG
jgi:hypothetical protein